MKRVSGFGLGSVILIMIITAIVSGIATGVIMMNNPVTNEIVDNNSFANDAELMEFIDIYKTLLSKYYDEIDKEGMLNAAEKGMLDFLGDKYTTYLKDSEYGDIFEELQEKYYGIGITIEGNKIVSVTSDSPAETAGLLINDVIIKVNNIDVTNASSTAIKNLITKEKETVMLTIDRNGLELNFNIEIKELTNTTVSYEILENTSIGYIKIGIFSENLENQIKNALVDMEGKGINGLVIDVRDNVGGYLASAENTAKMFLAKGKTIYSLETNSGTYQYKDNTSEQRKYKIAVLINGTSASASEILAAALKESYGAILVGEKTYGKGKVQQMVSLNSGDSLKYTSAKWLTPNGVCIDGIGIAPDYHVSYNKLSVYDTQIEKAISLIK